MISQSMITKQFLTERMGLCNELYSRYCNKMALTENVDTNRKFTKYSRLPDDVPNRCITSYITFRKCSVPRLMNNFNKENYAEYIFDEKNILLQKINHSSNGKINCFYVYNQDLRLRLTFRDNVLIEILSNCYKNGNLSEIFTAHFTRFGEVESISGEIYENNDNVIYKAEKYYDFYPKQPMLMVKEILGQRVTLNPSTLSYSFNYIENQKLPKVFYDYADGKCIDRFILW